MGTAPKAMAQDTQHITLLPTETYQGELLPSIHLSAVYIYAPMRFKNEQKRKEFTRLIRDVKKVYPYAIDVATMLIETFEYLETLPDDKAKSQHLKAVEKYVMDTYKPRMKKLTKNQGRILMKLIDRECNVTSYEIVKALVGSFKAKMFNIFAGLFGNSLKQEYDPEGKDHMIERIVIGIRQGEY